MRSFGVLSAALVALFASSATALPGGAPKCAINPAIISGAHKAPSDAGFKISASAGSYTPGQPMKITVEGGANPIAGLLMYATPGAADDAAAAPNVAKQHVGVFNVPQGFRAQTADICNAAGIQNEGPESTITHAGGADKGNRVEFDWTAPAADVGPITINAAVTSGGPGSPWQVVPIVTLQGAGGAGAGAGTGTGAPIANGTHKCKARQPAATGGVPIPTGTAPPATPGGVDGTISSALPAAHLASTLTWTALVGAFGAGAAMLL
ncbi:hypothetical protein HDU85_000439 [Gaertneriomyces sp. JEL0708]|nr:hypothetical protein HDU85_000439 [Gaertneriomyces sp. JEL0708]